MSRYVVTSDLDGTQTEIEADYLKYQDGVGIFINNPFSNESEIIATIPLTTNTVIKCLNKNTKQG